MKEINPELNAQVNQLASYCGETLEGKEIDFVDSTTPIINALVVGGYDRLSDLPLSNRVEEVAVDRFGSLAIHRRAQLRSLCDKLQEAYDERKRWHASESREDYPSRPANISSSTDA